MFYYSPATPTFTLPRRYIFLLLGILRFDFMIVTPPRSFRPLYTMSKRCVVSFLCYPLFLWRAKSRWRGFMCDAIVTWESPAQWYVPKYLSQRTFWLAFHRRETKYKKIQRDKKNIYIYKKDRINIWTRHFNKRFREFKTVQRARII